MSSSVASFSLGDKISSYSTLNSKIQQYQSNHAVQLIKRDCRLLEAARKRTPKRVEEANKDLKYFSMHFSCIFGGKKYLPRGKGMRPNQSTFKQDCPARIKFVLSEDGQHLVVSEICDEHNHVIDRDVYNHLPQQRRLDCEERKEAKELLLMKANKKLVQRHIAASTGKAVTLRDLSNVRGKRKLFDLKSLIERLRSIKGSIVEITTEGETEMSGLFFQDAIMVSAFAAFPEVLALDATYKLNNLKMPLYVFLAIDGDGQSEIVAVCITANETRIGLKKMVNCFKNNNPRWAETCVLITDKDITEREVLKECFPNAVFTLCLFHTLRSFKREITTEKLKITSGERDFALELMTKFAYAKSEEEYQELYRQLEQTRMPSLKAYFDSNWHDIRSEWVDGLKGEAFTLGERTNNRLESMNAKIKSVCTTHANLSTFFDEFLSFLSTIRNERDHTSLMNIAKRRVILGDETEAAFAAYLTPFAFSRVARQHRLRTKVEVLSTISPGQDNRMQVLGVRGDLHNVDAENGICECRFNYAMRLPCCHIFAVRSKRDLPLFDKTGIAERWTITYMKQYLFQQRGKSSESAFDITPIDENAGSNCHKLLSQHEKYRRADKISRKLSELCSEVGMRGYIERIDALKRLVDLWSSGRTALVSEMTEDSDREEGIEESTNEHNTEPEHLPESQPDEVNNSDGTSRYTEKDKNKSQFIEHLTLPPIMRKRGRPKGSEKTVIGLPRKKRRQDGKPLPFRLKDERQKVSAILGWFVDEQVVQKALGGKLIEEKEIESRPEFVSPSCLDEQVCLEAVRKFFTEDGWLLLQDVVATLRQNPKWLCLKCLRDAKEGAICCNSCLQWHHFECVGLNDSYKSRYWFCRSCYGK